MSNTGPNGELNTDAFQQAILLYRNAPDPITKLSPAMCLFGRPIKDLIPILPGHYEPHPTWKNTLDKREDAIRNRHMRLSEKWSEHTKQLPPLKIGDCVRIQNQIGHHPTKWDRTGTVTEVRQFDQYVVRVDGSGRATLRNRKFLRKYIPVHLPIPRRTIHEDLRCVPQPSSTSLDTQLYQPIESPQCQLPLPVPDTSTESTQPLPTQTSVPDSPSQTPSPASQTASPAESPEPRVTTSLTKPPKVPMALRRLATYNKKGLKE